jgi:two-component system nitrate/nitrite response regulator NarL
MIRVHLLGDVRLNREALATLLVRDGRLGVSGHGPSADDLLLRSGSVDVLVVDTSGHAGLEATRRVIGDAELPVVALGVPDDPDHVIALAELGVVGFVEREASLDELVGSVVSAARGEATCPPRIATTLIRRVSSLAAVRHSADVTALTARERQVVQLIAEGLSNKEIAARLCIEVATVKNHVHNILEKLEVNRRSDAVARLRVVETAGETPPTVRLAATRSTTGSSPG